MSQVIWARDQLTEATTGVRIALLEGTNGRVNPGCGFDQSTIGQSDGQAEFIGESLARFNKPNQVIVLRASVAVLIEHITNWSSNDTMLHVHRRFNLRSTSLKIGTEAD